MIIRGLLFIVFFAIIAFLLGNAFLILINWKRTISASYAWGLLILFSSFQIIAYPLYRIGTSFSFLVWLFSGMLISGLIVSIRIAVINHSITFYCTSIKDSLCSIRINKGITFALILAILLYFVFSLGFYYSTSDDGYYITRSLEAISQDKLQFSEQFAWYGWGDDTVTDYKDCTTLSFFVAFLSVLSGIQCTVLNKTFFAFLLILAHFSAISYLYDIFLKKEGQNYPRKAVFFIFYILFQLLCVKESSAGTWVVGFIWVGKAMLIAIIFPMLLATCSILFDRLETFMQKEWIAIPIVLLSGIAVSIVGIYLPVILYFTFGLAILISSKFKYFKKIWKPVLISALPIFIFIILSYIGVVQGTDLANRSGIVSSGPDPTVQALGSLSSCKNFIQQAFSAWMTQFWQAIDFWQFALYALSLLWFLIRGTEKQKVFFVLSSAILFLTFLNPLFIDIVSKYVTTSIVYWRLFWLLPLYFIPAIAISDILYLLLEDRLQKGLLCIGMVLCIISGFEIFRYSVTSAEYSIVPFVRNIGKLFNVRPELRFGLDNLNAGSSKTAQLILDNWAEDDRPMVLMCYNRPFELRMFSERIALAAPVRDYINGNLSGVIPGTDVGKGDFFVSFETITDADYLKDMLSRLNIDYVCFSQKPNIADLENHGISFIGEVYGTEVWKVVYE